MPIYQIYFDTLAGEKRYDVDIDESEAIENALPDILADLADRGQMLKGVSTGHLKVVWSGHQLDMSRTLPDQGVRPNDILRVLVDSYEGGGHSLRMNRIEGEWRLLQELQTLNPQALTILKRKSQPTEEVFYIQLQNTPGIERIEASQPVVRYEHTLRFGFPRFYPEVPIECYVREALLHPNVRLETGFVCLWEQFSLGDTIIQAICRAQAIAAYRMINLREEHVMNRQAADWYVKEGKPQGMVPLGGPELQVFYTDNGQVHWLEPGRSSL